MQEVKKAMEVRLFVHDGYFIEVIITKRTYRAYLYRASIGYKMPILRTNICELTLEEFLAYILVKKWDKSVASYKAMFEDEQ